MTAEHDRLAEYHAHRADWKRWGPYLAERAWGTVREDYSADGSAWTYFPHDHARSRAYRWNEDGLLGISDRDQHLCFALALWNGRDPILKERLFGLSGPEGNHGEDAKEYWFYEDCTPTHSYMRALYKYPQAEFPYAQLVAENARRTRQDPEYELLDTGVFDGGYFDVRVEYAKADADDLLIAITATNRGSEEAALHLLPTLWFRNYWSWTPGRPKPSAAAEATASGPAIRATFGEFGDRWLVCSDAGGAPEMLFTENETNEERLFAGGQNASPYVKDAFHTRVVGGIGAAVNPAQAGTKAAAWYAWTLAPGEERTLRLRLTPDGSGSDLLGDPFTEVLATRIREADEFYATVAPEGVNDERRHVQRTALAGLLWSKQFYNFSVLKWLRGDPGQPTPPDERWEGRNAEWQHLWDDSVMSIPDKWEYPWFAAWDLAFHCVAYSIVDSDFAKRQLILLLREWYMHPNGQLPAYEWEFGDVNPPVHAWAALRVFRIERRITGEGDTEFLERVFHKLLLNFTWWVNRKDADGRNVFQGGFLGLDNIGMFDRSKPLPVAGHLDQSDGTSWMAAYCLNMLAIALELAAGDRAYEDVATKFLEHFFYIAHAMNDRGVCRGDDGVDLWDDVDRFYYDVLDYGRGRTEFLRIRSVVGLLPLCAVETMDDELLQRLPNFARRLEWFLEHRPDLTRNVASTTRRGMSNRRLFSIVNEDRLRAILARMLDPDEFLSDYGIRSMSRTHLAEPVTLVADGSTYSVDYEPGESTTGLFGGNSNWRGPVWMPINYLLIEALQKFDYYYGEDLKVECPTGSGRHVTLWEAAVDLSQRLMALFERGTDGRRPIYGNSAKFQDDPHWRDLLLFPEYFHGDTGEGLGAGHQTGWTAIIAKLIQQSGMRSSADGD